ncbi:type II CAAX prenyl endopeptidase Rce1 family protein [Sphingobacterium sp. UBA5670]|uniref:CPBP family glutamic-type intramembrane protease n=1 Tax=Sphingobacterium sp. UBA5670 TaxID=1947502 RepID=UPI0039C96EDA
MSLVVIAPILETLFVQVLVLELLLKLRISASMSVLIAAIILGLFRCYNIWYFLATIISGFVFAYYYMALRSQGRWNKILLIIALHALVNVVSFLSNYT